jgi:plastocyanin
MHTGTVDSFTSSIMAGFIHEDGTDAGIEIPFRSVIDFAPGDHVQFVLTGGEAHDVQIIG